MGEFKRIFNLKMILIIFGVVVFNLFLFSYEQLSGLGINDFRSFVKLDGYMLERYQGSLPEDALTLLNADNVEISKIIHQNNEEVEPETEISEISRLYNSLDKGEKARMITDFKDLRGRLTYIINYHGNMNDIQKNAEKLKKYKLFSKTDSYSYNNIQKTASDFSRVKDVEISLVNDKAIDSFTDYFYIYYFSFACMVAIIYKLFTERENGMWNIVHTSKSGRGKLALKRFFLIMSGSILITGLLYFSTILMSLIMYGGWRESGTPIQTISKFEKFPYAMDKLDYIFLDFLVSWAAVFVMSVVLWSLFVLVRNRNNVIIITGVILGVELFLFKKISIQSNLSYLKHINIINLFQMNNILSKYNHWGFGVHVWNVIFIVMYALLALLIIATLIAVCMTIIMRPEAKTFLIIRKIGGWLYVNYQKIFMHLPVVFKEFHKLIISSKGFWVAGAVIIASLYFCSTGITYFNDKEKEYDKMYIEHGGEDYSYIVQYIADEEKYYNEIMEKYNYTLAKYNAGETDLKTLADAASNLNFAKNRIASVLEYKSKVKYLETLKEEKDIDGFMISERGYEQCFGKLSSQREIVLLIILTTGIMLIISECISLEYKTGMEYIIKSANRGRSWLLIRKVIACIGFTLLMYTIVYGIDLIRLNQIYGMPYLNAPVQSLAFMQECKFGVSIAGWIGIRLAIRLVVAMVTMVIAIIVSRILGKKGNRSLTIFISVLIILAIIAIFGTGGRF